MSFPLTPWWAPSYDSEAYNWRRDLRERRAFLYGDPVQRDAANAADEAAWKRLGRREVAA